MTHTKKEGRHMSKKAEDRKVTQHLIEELEEKFETAQKKYHRNETTMRVDHEYVYSVYSCAEICELDDEVGDFDRRMIREHFEAKGLSVEIKVPHHTELEITIKAETAEA